MRKKNHHALQIRKSHFLEELRNPNLSPILKSNFSKSFKKIETLFFQMISFFPVAQKKHFEPEEETEEEKHFRAIYEQISGEVSAQRDWGQHWTNMTNVWLFYVNSYVKYCSSIDQDMQICASELKTIMKNVLSKRKYTGKITFKLCVRCWWLKPSGTFLQIVTSRQRVSVWRRVGVWSLWWMYPFRVIRRQMCFAET